MEVLRHFHAVSLHSTITAFDYYRALERLSDPFDTFRAPVSAFTIFADNSLTDMIFRNACLLGTS